METTKKANISFCLKLNEFLNVITSSKWNLLFKDPPYKDFRYKEDRKATEGDGPSKVPQLRVTVVLKETSWRPGITMYSPLPVTENQCAVLETNTGNQTIQRKWASIPQQQETYSSSNLERLQGGAGKSLQREKIEFHTHRPIFSHSHHHIRISFFFLFIFTKF